MKDVDKKYFIEYGTKYRKPYELNCKSTAIFFKKNSECYQAEKSNGPQSLQAQQLACRPAWGSG
ncbi:hypothetical protein SEVIR_4G116266v4 [Setaria viridis]